MSATALKVVALISGRGSNLQALLDAAREGTLGARIAAVISNVPGAQGLARAEEAGVAAEVVDHRAYSDRELFDAALAERIDAHAPDLVVLAGFMRILTPAFVRRYTGRMLNIHPSLLPKFRGLNTHARAIEAGEREHGASIHFVTEELDGGPVFLQARVPVAEGDSEQRLAQRVLEQEHRLYPQAVRWFAAGRLRLDGERVLFDGAPLGAPLLLDREPAGGDAGA